MSAQSTRINVYVQPRSSKTGVAGMHDGWVKIRLTAPPVDNAANLALIDYLSGVLSVPKRGIRIVSGLTGRRKVVEIDGMSQAAIDAAFL